MRLFSRPFSELNLHALLLVCAVLLATHVRSQDQGVDPSGIWYQGFLAFEATGELEKQGKYLEALNKCADAKRMYDTLAYQFPEFQPEVVKYKRQVLADTRLRIIHANKQRKAGGAPSPSPIPGRPRVNSRPVQIQQGSEFPMVNTPSHGGPTQGTQIIQPDYEPEYYPGPGNSGSNVLPNWNQDRRVGQIANQMLDEARDMELRSQSKIQALTQENDRLRREMSATEARLSSLQSQVANSQQREADLRRQLDQYERDPNNQSAVQKAQQYKSLLQDTMKALADATAQNDKLLKQLQASRTKNRILEGQIEQLKAERDNLASIIQGKGIGTEAFRNLMQENQRLTQRLELAEKVARKSADDNEQKEEDIAVLKTEIQKVRQEHDRLVEENVRHQQQIENLHRKLEILSDGLSPNDKQMLARMAPEQRAENELLRGMVLKQLRRQAQHKTAKELLLRQLDRVGARSEVLLEIVEDLARGPQLSPKEKSLFRSPEFAELLESVPTVEKDAGPLVDPNVGEFELTARAGDGRGVQVINGQKISVELSQLDKSARLDFHEGRYAEAEAGFLKYLHFRPRHVGCLCNLGVLKLALHNYADAEQYLQKAVAIDRKSGRAQYLLGRTFFLQQKYDEALNHLKLGLQIEPKNAQAHNCIGVIASQKGWVTQAERSFVEAVKIDPEFGDAHFNLAVLFTTRSQPDAKRAGYHYYEALKLEVPRDAAIEDFLKRAAQVGAYHTPSRAAELFVMTQ